MALPAPRPAPFLKISSAVALAADELNQKSMEIDKAVQSAPPDVQNKINAIQSPTTNVVPDTITLADVGQKKLLRDKVQAFAADAEKKEHMYRVLSVISICLSAVLALVGGIASFL